MGLVTLLPNGHERFDLSQACAAIVAMGLRCLSALGDELTGINAECLGRRDQ
jgi:hypothetical protein